MSQANIKQVFLLNPEITFLNHGSFGACPKSVFEDYQNWQGKLEAEPIQFITKTGVAAYRKSKEVFANEFSCDVDDFFFTSNPSTAFNTVIKSLQLEEGDEILSTDLEYGAMDRTWHFYCKQSGAKYVQQAIPLPIQSKEHFLDAFWKGLTSKTKYIFLSHLTSNTALILPVEEICKKAKELGLITIIDGAHVPGHIPLNLTTLQADYYTGAMHKWYLAPKGFSFLHVKKAFQAELDPLIVSWGYESDFPSHSQFLDYHEYNGTRDFSAYLTMPALKQFWLENDWANKAAKSRELILEWYPKFCKLLNTAPLCPVNSDFLGQMCSIPIRTTKPLELKELLYQKYRIEIPVTNRGKDFFIRISIQGYTEENELEYLYAVLKELLSEGSYLN
jgi:isopenicillin-N epimerase